MNAKENNPSAIWNAMQDEDAQMLKEKIMPGALFVHMGITADRDEEIDIIMKRGIVYDKIDNQKPNRKQGRSGHVRVHENEADRDRQREYRCQSVCRHGSVHRRRGSLRLASMSYTRIND